MTCCNWFETQEKIHESEAQARMEGRTEKRPESDVTIFGQLIYERSQCQHKESKQYTYLVDEQIGITLMHE